jgi:hypothetical protein
MEDDIMKTLITMTALVTLLVGFGTATQASETPSPWSAQAPQLQLAEGGSERVIRRQQRMQVLAVERGQAEEVQRFVQLLEEQPTAAGNVDDALDTQSVSSQPDYESPILRDRAIYGSQH